MGSLGKLPTAPAFLSPVERDIHTKSSRYDDEVGGAMYVAG